MIRSGKRRKAPLRASGLLASRRVGGYGSRSIPRSRAVLSVTVRLAPYGPVAGSSSRSIKAPALIYSASIAGAVLRELTGKRTITIEVDDNKAK